MTPAIQRVGATNAMRPFRVDISQSELTDLRRRILATRLPERERVIDFSQGMPRAGKTNFHSSPARAPGSQWSPALFRTNSIRRRGRKARSLRSVGAAATAVRGTARGFRSLR